MLPEDPVEKGDFLKRSGAGKSVENVEGELIPPSSNEYRMQCATCNMQYAICSVQ